MAERKNQADLKEMLTAVFDVVDSNVSSAHFFVAATRSDLCNELIAFGEDAVAEKMASLSKETLAEIFRLAGELDTRACTSSRGQSLCLAAVEIVEGCARPLACRRRRNSR